MAERISFHGQISKNKRNSVFLIIIIFLIFLAIGYVIALARGPGYIFITMIFSIVFSISYLLIGYYKSDKIALSSVNAVPAPKEAW